MNNEDLKRYVVSGDDIQVGDTVRIKPYSDDFIEDNVFYAEQMKQYAGMEYEVKHVSKKCVYLKAPHRWSWHKKWVEKV